ncbi:restriction endonuclease subunit S [Sphingobacterium faecium]|uniref:restriction endonuclease subunit S n=1 Tax=Sphingobacterium faecium TaxID=34087 RepID=UPI0024797A8D|nr:restriction endonuclease subunit S [Sphingobacterium faecium]WGQ14745.1 restriction endonuclease subunit S [Sphingobacterium faecium]
MSYLEKLLEGVAVEWQTVGDIFQIKNGYTPSKQNKEYWTNGTIPWFRMEDIRKNGRILSDSIQHVSESAVKGANYFPANSIIVATSATIGEHALIEVPYLSNQRFTNLSLKDEFKGKLIAKFLYYYCFLLDEWCKANITIGNFAGVDMVGFKKFKIPIPCPDNPKKSIEIQQKIVGILDSFTELTAKLTAELTAELTARKTQYSYYRESLYSFDKNIVKHLPLGDESIGKFIRGGGLQKKDFTETGVGCIHYGQIYTYYGTYTDKTKSFVSEEFARKARMAKYGDLVIATTSENDEDLCKAVAWLGDKEIAVSSDACFYRHNLNPKYVAYFFQTEQFQKQKRSFITGTKVRRVNADDLAKIKIPVPSKEEQERVATILEKFDTLTNSISEGLPKEIKLRQKQYEYYRNLLLAFPQDNLEL